MALRPLGARARQAAITAACFALRPLFTRRQAAAQIRPQRIIVFRRCCLGDTLMMTPLLASLDAAYPDAEIAYAVGKWSAAALAGSPYVDTILPLPDRPTRRDWARIVGKLRRGGYDLALVPERSPLPGLALALAGVPRRVGLDSAGRGFALTDRVPLRDPRHETDLALDLARALDLSVENRRPIFQPSPEATAHVDRLLAERGAAGPLFVVHPGGGSNPGMTMDTKRWPAARFANVATGLCERHGGTIAIVGAASDRELVAATLAALDGAALDLSGQLTLDQLGALCARAALYLGNDAGTTHLAEASGAPVVAVFGPTDPAQYGPTDGISEAAWNPLTCGPHLQRGDLTRAPVDTARCIDTISVEDVLAAAERVLARAGAR